MHESTELMAQAARAAASGELQATATAAFRLGWVVLVATAVKRLVEGDATAAAPL